MKHFVTVEWCKSGGRGVFCRQDGSAFWKESEPFTTEEMREILGPFWIVLSPESRPFSKEELQQFSQFNPLAEYSGAYGIAKAENA